MSDNKMLVERLIYCKCGRCLPCLAKVEIERLERELAERTKERDESDAVIADDYDLITVGVGFLPRNVYAELREDAIARHRAALSQTQEKP